MGKNYGGLILGGLALLYLLRKGTSTSGGVGSGLTLQLLDEQGRVVAGQGGASMSALTWNPFGSTGAGLSTTEGRSYTLRAIVTNKSTKDGLPVNVVFKVLHTVTVGGVNRLGKTQDVTFQIGSVGTFLPANADGTFTLLTGDAGKPGEVTVVVQAPTGAEVARASDTFTIGSSAPTYSATVSLTPIQSAENYLAQIAATTSRAELETIYATASADSNLSSAQKVLVYDAYVAKVYSGTLLSNRQDSFARVLAGR